MVRLSPWALGTALCLAAGCASIRLGGSLGDPAEGGPRLPIERVWERDVQAAFGPGAPHLTTRYALVGTRRGEVVILDLEDGEIAGAQGFGESIEGALGVGPSATVLYIPTAERRGGIIAFDVRAGRQLWAWRGGGVMGGAVLVDGVVVVGALDGRVIGLDAATGEVRWEDAPDAPRHIHAASLAIGGGRVVVADDRGRVTVREAATGTAVLTVEVGEPIYRTPAQDGPHLYVATTRGTLAQIDLTTGSQRTLFSADGDLRLTTPAVGAPGVAVGLTDGSVVAVDPGTGDVRWTYRTDGNVSAAPLWVGDTLFVGTMDQRVVALDGRTGAEVWSDTVRGRVKSALAAGGRTLVVLTEPRHVVAYRTVGRGDS